MRRTTSIGIIFLLATSLAAEVSFSDLDLAETNELLFTATAQAPGFGDYRTLFHANLSEVSDQVRGGVAGGDVLTDAPLKQLTYFPEILTYLPALQAVQIQNRFGIFRGSVTTGEFTPVPGFASFAEGASVPNGRILPVTASPDGRYLVILEPTSAAYGDLVLQRTDGSDRTVVARNVELSTEVLPARWAPDSQFFVYSRAQSLYYYSIRQYERGRLLGETFRELGPGTLQSVRWSDQSSLYYVSGTLVYEILGAEFFTRSLYSGLLQIGTIIGKLPFPFDPNFDSFAIGPDGETALLNKGGRNLFVLFLNPDDFSDASQILGLPSLFLPRNTRVRQIAWSELGFVTILAGSIAEGVQSSRIFRLDLRGRDNLAFERMDDANIHEIRLSPDNARVALLGDGGVTVRSSTSWARVLRVDTDSPIHAVWIDNDRLLVGTDTTVDVISVASGERSILTLAQTVDHDIAEDGTITALSGGTLYTLNGQWRAVAPEPEGETATTDTAAAPPRVAVPGPKRVAGSRFRVFLESLSSGAYRNIVMIRRVRGVGTSRLFPPPAERYEAFPLQDDPIDFAYFTNGSRIRRREISLVFNAIDNVEGLTEILNALAGFDVTATFFVNGEFVRRHPTALAEIADAGHEVGSLFFAYFDMADRRYRITREFIQEGLSRNEDEYFRATGRELSLLWHAPFYFVSDEILEAAREANYIYVGRDVDSLDWVPRRTDEGLSQLYRPASQLIERILAEKQPGSIVSMQVGTLDGSLGGRDDYLFQYLDILINGLLQQGYEVVPVSTLIENAR